MLEALYGEHAIPPGDVGVVAFISTRKEEAGERLRTIKAILDALGVRYSERDQTLELRARPILFRVFVASIAGVVGFTSIMVIADEVARWRDNESGANPAEEVLASLRPTVATQPNAKIILSSSPLGSNDAHAKAFDRGERAQQCVAFAPTWEANPTISEQQTRADEPDERIWAREYAAIPQAGRLAAFDETAVLDAFKTRASSWRSQRYVFIDASSGRKDAFTWAVGGWTSTASLHKTERKDQFFELDLVDGVDGSFWKQIKADDVIDRIATVARTHGCTHVHGDQREAFMMETAFGQRGLSFSAHTWTNANKVAAVELLRRWFKERMVVLPDHDRLRRELAHFEERITPSGSFTFEGRGAHDDYVSLLITAAMVAAKDELDRDVAGRDGWTNRGVPMPRRWPHIGGRGRGPTRSGPWPF